MMLLSLPMTFLVFFVIAPTLGLALCWLTAAASSNASSGGSVSLGLLTPFTMRHARSRRNQLRTPFLMAAATAALAVAIFWAIGRMLGKW